MNFAASRSSSALACTTQTKDDSPSPKLVGKLTGLCLALGCLIVLFSPLQGHAQKTPNIINTVAGGGSVIPNGSTPLTADVPGPTAVVKDASGNIYFASPTAEYVYKLSSTGVLTLFAGQGVGGFSGDGGPATKALIASPSGMAIDSAGNIYISDSVSNRVRKIDTSGNINTVAGTSTICFVPTNPCGDGGPATSAHMYAPQGLAVDSAGNLYIADSFDNRIRRVDATTGIITTVAGSGNQCAASNSACGDGTPATSAGANLNTPFGVAVDAAGNIFVADTFDHRVRKVDTTGTIRAYAGTGVICNPSYANCGDGFSPTASTALLHLPKDVVVDGSGNLYIADTADHRIRFVDSAQTTISTFAGVSCTSCTNNEGFSGDGGSPTAALLNFPQSLAVDGAGNVVIADTGNQRIRAVSTGITPTINTVAGGGNAGDGGAPLAATLAKPLTVVIEPSGSYLICDQGHNSIRRVSSSGVITTVAGSGILGATGDGGLATLATLNTPFGVTEDQAGNIYIADSYNSVVRKVDATTKNISTYAGNGFACVPQIAACGDGGPATSGQITQPTSVSVDANGNLFITDFFGQRVRRVDAATHVITTAAGTGFAGYNGDNIPATTARIKFPFGIAADAAGDFFIADTENSRVRKVDTSSPPIITTYALNGSSGFSGDGGLATKAAMGSDNQVAVDPAGNVYISGGIYDVVRRVDVSTQTIATVAGTTQNPSIGGFSGDGGPAKQARMNNAGVSVDSAGDLFIADTGNNRIRYVLMAPTASLTPASRRLQFPPTPLNTTSSPLAVTLTNSGSATLTIPTNGITTSGPFAQTNNCSASLAPLQVCTINVTFTPTQDGPIGGVLTINDNAAGPQTVSLTGNGPNFSISANPTTVTSSVATPGTTTVTITPSAGFNQPVIPSCSGLPTGGRCLFATNPITPDGTNPANSLLTITVSNTTPKGSFTVTVRGTRLSLSHTTPITLTVQ